MLEVLNIGDKVDIRRIHAISMEEGNEICYSQVINKDSAVRIQITMPTAGTKMVPLDLNESCECTFYTEKGLYAGTFKVLKRFREGNLPILLLECQTSLQKVQRRQYYRFSCMLPMKYRKAEKDEKIEREQFNALEWKDGIVLDLSGGGIRFVIPDRIENKSYLQFKLVLEVRGEYKEFFIYGKLIGSRVKENNVRLHECQAEFVKLSEADRDQIISYIFAEERKKRNVDQ